MDAHLELWSSGEARLVPLEGADVSIGRDERNDIVLPFDPMVSRLHAVVVRYRGGWCLKDVGSANGTYLNNRRLLKEQFLRSGDEIRVGAAKIIFRGDSSASPMDTFRRKDSGPRLTDRERDVLLALCRPLIGAETFAQPAADEAIGAELHVTKKDVQYHLSNLYDKFGISRGNGPRRARLASAAIDLGIVSRFELTAHDEPEERLGRT